VLQALEEAGIPIDYIGGTSMGALIAAAYARGWSPPKILDKVREVLLASRAVIDLTFPMAALLAGKKLDAVLTTLFGDIAIEDLWINFFCISSSVSQAKMVVHKEGPLWQSVRASLSLPGIFPPVQTGGQVLVDGGVMNNVPMDIMRAECGEGGTVIAIDVGGSGGQDSVWGKGDRSGVSGWRLLGKRLSSLSRPETGPSIFQTLAWSTTLSSDQYLKQLISQGTTNLFLTPPVQDFQLLGFEAYMELYEAGYQYTRQRLAEWEGTSRLRGRTES
jgi:NTE family protein/lysophospholipid hydrolase